MKNKAKDFGALTEAVILFTAKSVERILQDGGTASWRLDRNHARRCLFAVCTRNAHAEWAEGQEAHQSAFLVGKIRDVVVSPEPGYEDRYLIRLAEYALVNIPEVWHGDRNPVKYSTLEEIGIDLSALNWVSMPPPELCSDNRPAVTPYPTTGPLTIADAKKGLALTFGVPPETIEITIRC